MTPSKKEIAASLDRICKHKLFAKSALYGRLLTYLVEKHENKEDLKEYTIGADLFGEDYGLPQKEGAVRSYMYQLRKRLNGYYDDPTTMETFRFEIKKGQYNLSIEETDQTIDQKLSEENKVLGRKYSKFTVPGIVLTLVFILIITITMLLQKISTDNMAYFWSPFLESDDATKVIISDQFMLVETNQHGEDHSIVYGEINSLDDFVEYTKQHPDRQLRQTDYTLMSKMTPFSMKRFSRWFFEHDRDFTFLLESQLNYDDVLENNLIFVGQYKTMNFSKSLFLRKSKVFSTHRDGFKYSADGKEEKYNTIFGKNEKVEYAMISYDSYVPGKNVIDFVSNNDIGVMAMVRNFTDKAWLSEFVKKLPVNTSHFNALFEVAGIQRNDVSCKLVKLEIVEPE